MTPAQYLLLGCLRADELGVLTTPDEPYGLTFVDNDDDTHPIRKIALRTSSGLTLVCGDIAKEGDPDWGTGLIQRYMQPFDHADVGTMIENVLVELEDRTSELRTEWATEVATDVLGGGEAGIVADLAGHTGLGP